MSFVPIPSVPAETQNLRRVRFDQAIRANVARHNELFSQNCAHGSFVSNEDQSHASTNTAKAVTVAETLLSVGVRHGSSPSRIYCDRAGVYQFSFSVQLKSTSASLKNAFFWPRLNGLDVPNSATKVSIASNTASVVPAWDFLYDMKDNEYFELYWAVDDTGVFLDASVATNFCPAIPSVIIHATQVGRILE